MSEDAINKGFEGAFNILTVQGRPKGNATVRDCVVAAIEFAKSKKCVVSFKYQHVQFMVNEFSKVGKAMDEYESRLEPIDGLANEDKAF